MSQFLLARGEHLVGAVTPYEVFDRFGDFGRITGLGPDDIAASMLVAIPLPVYPEHWPEGHRRWTEVRPEAMGLPLMWLPDVLAGRYDVELDDGDVVAESVDDWAVRVCLWLEQQGLYDQSTGEWTDVLAPLGIDVSSEEGRSRVQRWLSGGPDEVLDTFALEVGTVSDEPAESFFDEPEPASQVDASHRAFELATVHVYADPGRRTGDGFLRVLARATHSAAFASEAEAVRDDDSDMETKANAMAELVEMATTMLSDAPDFPAHLARWQSGVDNWDGFTEDGLRNGVITPYINSMREINELADSQVHQLAVG